MASEPSRSPGFWAAVLGAVRAVMDATIHARKFAIASAVLAVMGLACVVLYWIVRRSGPRPFMISHTSDIETFVREGLDQFLTDMRALQSPSSIPPSMLGFVASLRSKPEWSTLTASDLQFYIAFYKLVHSPDDFLVRRDANAISVLAYKDVTSRLCSADGTPDWRAIRAWIDAKVPAIDGLCAAITEAVAALAVAPPAPSADAAVAAHRLLRMDLMMNQYVPELTHAYDMRKTQGRRIQFVMFGLVLGGMWRHVLKEARDIWDVPGAYASAVVLANAIFARYAAPNVQRTMLNLADRLAAQAGRKDRTITVA